MSKKTFNLIAGITTGVAAIGAAVVTFFNPPYCAAINASITVVEGAVVTICSKFVKDE